MKKLKFFTPTSKIDLRFIDIRLPMYILKKQKRRPFICIPPCPICELLNEEKEERQLEFLESKKGFWTE